MQPSSRATAPLSSDSITSNAQAIHVLRSDRWSIYYRLQELMISCWCLEDGTLWADVADITTAVLVHSVVRQFVAPRRELVNWLERCWQIEV